MKPLTYALAVLIPTWTATAFHPDETAANINPAQLYYQAFLSAPEAISSADSDYLYSKEGRSQPIPPRFADLVTGYDAQFRLVRKAARSSVPCDWGIDLSAGPSTPLPHLARAKAVALAARLRVRWQLEHGQQLEAVDDLLATFALARNLSRDGLMISSLVQMAMEAILCNIVAEQFGMFSTETLERLETGLKSLPPRGTVAQCISSERTLFHDWAISRIRELQRQHPGDDADVMAEAGRVLGIETDRTGDNYWERLKEASGGTSEGLIRLFQNREDYEARLVALANLPYADYLSQLGPFEAELETSPNPLISQTMASFVRARGREFRVLCYLAMVQAAIEYKVHGEAGFRKVVDPCSTGPFAFRRFLFGGLDRGFELKSVYDFDKNKAIYIFVETPGAPFYVDGPRVGTAITSTGEAEQFQRRYGIQPPEKK